MRAIVKSKSTLALGVVALTLLVAEDSRAHGDHATAPALLRLGPVEVSPITVFTHSLGRCVWQRSSEDTASGGLVVECGSGAVPINAAVYVASYLDPEHDHMVNLSPAFAGEWNGVALDGIIDGEPLADAHQHGEPPPDNATTEAFANGTTLAGGGIHYVDQGPTASNEVLTLCCESLDNKPDLNELENCRYDTEMVAVAPETHPDLLGQYVATLACSQGRVTSGGCSTQFLHSSAEYGLTGSHPYVNGDGFEHPDGAHSTTPGETGWACRLDDEPVLALATPEVAKVAVTVLCCY